MKSHFASPLITSMPYLSLPLAVQKRVNLIFLSCICVFVTDITLSSGTYAEISLLGDFEQTFTFSILLVFVR
jgi:hypothetical protein